MLGRGDGGVPRPQGPAHLPTTGGLLRLQLLPARGDERDLLVSES